MIIAFDTYYYNGYSYTVGGVFESWSSSDVSYYVTSKRECIDAEYKSGELYKRELPCIMQCLSMVNLDNIDTIIVDGFVWLSEDGIELSKGLGARLNDAIQRIHGTMKTIVGIAKNPYHVKIPSCIEVKHGLESEKPLYVTCSELGYAEYYATLVSRMHGDYRIPTILKLVDTKTREFKSKIEKEDDEDEISESSSPIGLDLSDLDKWAEETFSKPNVDKAIESWMAETEKNGFRCL